MSKPKYLKGECQHCAGHIEFPVETIGLSATCPHCGQETELRLMTPAVEPLIPRRVLLWTVITIFVLLAALAAVVFRLNYYKKRLAEEREQRAATNAPGSPKAGAEQTPPAEDPIAKAGFQVSQIKFEKTQGSSLVYAVGTVNNLTDKQRFAVRVEMELFDASGKSVGTAKDYQKVIEPKEQWTFRALIMEPKAVSAKITSLKEDEK